jgi:hypothetical protein
MKSPPQPANVRTFDIEGQPVRCIEESGASACGYASARPFGGGPRGIRRAFALTLPSQSCGVFRMDRSTFDRDSRRAASHSLSRSPRWSDRSRLQSPAPHGYGSPDRFDHAERPSTLKKSVHGAQRARGGECQDEPGTAILERVAQEHRGHGKEAKRGKGAHGSPL